MAKRGSKKGKPKIKLTPEDLEGLDEDYLEIMGLVEKKDIVIQDTKFVELLHRCGIERWIAEIMVKLYENPEDGLTEDDLHVTEDELIDCMFSQYIRPVNIKMVDKENKIYKVVFKVNDLYDILEVRRREILNMFNIDMELIKTANATVSKEQMKLSHPPVFRRKKLNNMKSNYRTKTRNKTKLKAQRYREVVEDIEKGIYD